MASAMAQVETARVMAWRAAEGAELDQDFAYWFTSYDETKATAGYAVAEAWQRVRGLQHPRTSARAGPLVAEEERGRRRVELTAAATVGGTGVFWDHVKNPQPKGTETRPTDVPWRKVTRQTEKAPSDSEVGRQKTRAVESLVSIMKRCGVHRPAGSKTSEFDWTRSLTRRAERKVDLSEQKTISGALATWKELEGYLTVNKLRLRDVGVVELEKFIFDNPSSSRAWAGMHWLLSLIHI